MMWVIRAGQNSLYYHKYIESLKVYLPWDGYKMDFFDVKTCDEFRVVVEREKGIDNRATISSINVSK